MKNITNKSDCLQANYRWIRRKYNFDNLIQVWTLWTTGPGDGCLCALMGPEKSSRF